MHDGGHRPAPTGGGRRRSNKNYRYFGTILFLGALGMILLVVLLNR